MKVALLTSFTEESQENIRIKNELVALGHEYIYIDLKEFSFEVKENKLDVKNLSGIKPDVVIFRGVLNSIKPISSVVRHLQSEGVKVFDNNLLVHQYSIDKVNDIIKLASGSIPLPHTFYARGFEEYAAKANEIGYPVVVKSVRSGKGVGVFKIDNEAELEHLVSGLKSQGKDPKSYIIQEFIPYIHDLRVLVIGDYVTAMKRIPPKDDFRANFSLGGTVEKFDLDDDTRELALRALSQVDMSVGGVDVLITEDGNKYILEVNHSAGFAGMEEATGQNIGKIYVEHALAKAV